MTPCKTITGGAAVGLQSAARCILALLASTAVAEERPSLACDVGPVEKTFGNTPWLVYSCSDHRSIVVVSAANSPAAPFVFIFAAKGSAYQLEINRVREELFLI